MSPLCSQKVSHIAFIGLPLKIVSHISIFPKLFKELSLLISIDWVIE